MFFGRKDPTVQELVTAVIVLRRGATVSLVPGLTPVYVIKTPHLRVLQDK